MDNRIPSSSPDLTQENIEKLKDMFPEIVTEGKIDFDMLRTVLGDSIDDRNERYKFEWHGKKNSLLGAQQPSKGTLRPDKASSKNFDTTENLYIEGDNLEVLKLLQKSYNGKVKMIYIDPPYNTGNDFVYEDDFKDNIQNYLEQTGQVDEEGRKQSTNTESSGRYHTDWLNMMYPRLKLARNLLKEDGAIFISIDQNESVNMQNISNEIFGEKNYIGEFVWAGGRKNDSKYISVSHEYVLIYAKNKQFLTEKGITWREKKPGLKEIYNKATELKKEHNNDFIRASESLKSWYKSLSENHPSKQHNHYSLIDQNGVFYTDNISWPGGGGPKYDILHPTTKRPVKIPSRGWLFSKTRMQEMIEKELVHFGEDETKVPTFKRYLKDTEYQVPYSVIYQDSRGSMKRLRELMNHKVFDFPKDEDVLSRFVEILSEDNDIILDFFSGSASTAHAVMLQNLEDNKKRTFIMVQLPEEVEKNSEAYNTGYQNISEIGQERIRRAGEKIREEHPDVADNLDVGFKVLRLDKSNIRQWNVDFEDIENTLETYQDVFVPGRSELDIVYEIMLKYGLELTYPISTFQVEGKNIYDIAYGNLFICLDEQIDSTIAQGIIDKRNEHGIETSTVVLADSGFNGNDSEKLNCFKLLQDAGYQDEQLLTI